MLQYIKDLNFITLAYIAHHIVGRVLAGSSGDPELEFRQACKWRPLKEGFEEAKVSRKPICLFIQKVGCPSCVKLKTRFSSSLKLIELTNQFVMITVEVTKREVGNPEKFQPDGKYVPRILFFTPDGELIREAYNRRQGNDKSTKYFYSNAAQIIDSMVYVLKNYTEEPLIAEYKFTRPVDDIDEELMEPTMLD